MSCVRLLVLMSVLGTTYSKGVTEWCVEKDKFLGEHFSGTYVYDDLEAAKEICLGREDCFGITKVPKKKGAKYTLRSHWKLMDSTSGETSYVPCRGFFNCSTFGLKSIHGTFLSANPAFTADWDKSTYGSLEQITFQQWGKDSGFLRSYHGRYLSATPQGKLAWDRTWKRDWELFKISQHENKISLKSAHGEYVSAQPDGTVDVDRIRALIWEWFIVQPQECINNIECDCSRAIRGENYELENVVYDLEAAKVHSDLREVVGFQYVHNKNGTSEQTAIFEIYQTRTETAIFTKTAGAEIETGTAFLTGFHWVEEGRIYEEISGKYKFAHGIARKKHTILEASYHCNAPPGSTVKCVALLFRYRSEVPYTQSWRHKRLACTCESSGVFSETSAHEMQLLVEQD